MNRRALFGLLLAVPASTSAAAFAERRSHEPAPAGFVRLLEPSEDAAWRAGGEATIAWEPGPAFELAAGEGPVEEWEAFLSLDGGASWPVRLTPHLGVDLRRVTVELPAIAAADARLLLRFGDERSELEVEAPRRLRLEPAPRSSAWPARRAWSSAESARPALPGALIWASGDRGGRSVQRFESQATDPALHSAHAALGPFLMPALVAPERFVTLAAATRGDAALAPERGGERATAAFAGPAAVDPLRSSCRLNL